MFLDNNEQFTLILNRRLDIGQLFNAASHLCIGLTDGMKCAEILDYKAADQPDFARISRHPVIVLSAKNSNQLRTLYEQADAEGIHVNAFTGTMLGRSAEEQLAATAALPINNMEFLAVGLFGPGDHLKKLTRRYSLWH